MATDAENGIFDNWPTSAKLTLSLAAAAAWIGVPLIVVWRLMDQAVQVGRGVDYQPMMAVLIAMTTATIAGTFLFMTFRIDRGTRLKAERVAREAADETLKGLADKIEKMDKKVEKIVREAGDRVDAAVNQRLDEGTTPEKIQERINTRITDDDLRNHVKAVLMLDAKMDIVDEYISSEAKNLDATAVNEIIARLERILESLSGHMEKERGQQEKEAGRTSSWGKIKRFFSRSKQS